MEQALASTNIHNRTNNKQMKWNKETKIIPFRLLNQAIWLDILVIVPTLSSLCWRMNLFDLSIEIDAGMASQATPRGRFHQRATVGVKLTINRLPAQWLDHKATTSVILKSLYLNRYHLDHVFSTFGHWQQNFLAMRCLLIYKTHCCIHSGYSTHWVTTAINSLHL